jgi:hypothetical protein
VSQFAGKRYVLAGSIKEPGVWGLMKPSMTTMATTEMNVSIEEQKHDGH